MKYGGDNHKIKMHSIFDVTSGDAMDKRLPI